MNARPFACLPGCEELGVARRGDARATQAAVVSELVQAPVASVVQVEYVDILVVYRYKNINLPHSAKACELDLEGNSLPPNANR